MDCAWSLKSIIPPTPAKDVPILVPTVSRSANPPLRYSLLTQLEFLVLGVNLPSSRRLRVRGDPLICLLCAGCDQKLYSIAKVEYPLPHRDVYRGCLGAHRVIPALRSPPDNTTEKGHFEYPDLIPSNEEGNKDAKTVVLRRN